MKISYLIGSILGMFLFLHNLQTIDAPTLTQKIIKLQPKINPIIAEDYSHLIKTYCHPLNENLIISIIFVESSFRFLAESTTGDIGLMQISLSTWGDELKVNKIDLLAPAINIEVGCKILKQIRKHHKHDPHFYKYYHTRTKEINEIYIKRVEKVLDRLHKP